MQQHTTNGATAQQQQQSMFFRGIVFNLSGKLIYSRDQLKKMVEQYGAECDLNVTKKVTHCVAHPDEVDQGTSTRVIHANKYHIPFIHEQFIYDCISAGKLLPVKLYTIVAKKNSVGYQQQNKTMKNKDDEDDNEDEDDLMKDTVEGGEAIILDQLYGTTNRPEIFTTSAASGAGELKHNHPHRPDAHIRIITRSSTNNLMAKPDVYFGVKSIVHTGNLGSEPVSYSAVLYKTNDQNNMQFIIMQLLRTFIGKYILYMRYGSVGSVGKIFTEVFHDVDEATMAFATTYKQYSGSVWGHLNPSTSEHSYSAVQFTPIGVVNKIAQGEQSDTTKILNDSKDVEMQDSTEERTKSDREDEEEDDDDDRLDIADEE